MVTGTLTDMNWQAMQVVMTALVGGAALLNYFVLQSIRLEIAKLNGDLKEWARKEFAPRDETDRHFDAIERRITQHHGGGN